MSNLVTHKYACGVEINYINTVESRAIFDKIFAEHRASCKGCKAKMNPNPHPAFGEPNVIQFAPFDIRPFPPKIPVGQLAE